MLRMQINFVGVITDRQSFLDGARQFMIEAEDQPATGWQMALAMRWPLETEQVEEGDLTLRDPSGAELTGSLMEGRASEFTDEDGNVNAVRVDLRFEVTGGEGGYAGASGSVRVHGTIAGEGEGTGGTYEGEGALLTAELDIQGEGDVWRAAPEQRIPT
jgi:hypothetical protein